MHYCSLELTVIADMRRKYGLSTAVTVALISKVCIEYYRPYAAFAPDSDSLLGLCKHYRTVDILFRKTPTGSFSER